MTECYILLLTPEGQTRDFTFVSSSAELARMALWKIAQLGSLVLVARLTDETGTQYIDPALLNPPAMPCFSAHGCSPN